MKTSSLLILLPLMFPLLASAAIDHPACDAMNAWAGSFTPPETRPRSAAIPDVFRGAAFADLFGKPVEQWSREDFQSLNQHMKDCQRKLFKQDRQAAKQMNKLRRHVPLVQRTLEQAAKASRQANEAVSTLLALPPSTDADHMLEEARALLRRDKTRSGIRGRDSASVAVQSLVRAMEDLAPGDARALVQQVQTRRAEIEQALAQQRQQAEAARARQRQQATAGAGESRDQVDQPARAQKPEADPERNARLAEQLQQQAMELRGYPFDELADLGNYLRRLQFMTRTLHDERNNEAAAASGIDDADIKALYQRFLTAVDEMQPKFLDYLASLPESKNGLNQARRAVARATGVRYANDVMREYLAAAQQRAGEIQAALVHARDYMDLSDRVDALLQGSSVSRASLGTLTPGMRTAEAIRLAEELWGYRKAPTLELKTVLSPTREAISRLKKGRRDGGRLTVSEMGQSAGQFEFVEHYKAKMELDSLRDQLTKRYGSPDSEQKIEHGFIWGWQQRDRRLQIKAKNQADVIMHAAGFRSRLAVALWNDRYEDYLDKASERCDRIRKKPQGERSMDDAAFFMKHQCPVVGGYRLEPGLDD